MPNDLDITHIFFKPVVLLFKDHFGLFTVTGYQCRQCGFQATGDLFHPCTSYLN